MKSLFNTSKAMLIAAIMLAGASFSPSAQAVDKAHGFLPIQSKEQAEKVPADAQVMMACGGCQSVQSVKPGGILGLFASDTKHDCPGCSGKLTFVGLPGKAGGTKYSHSCTKCGDASAYVCADHRG